MRTRRLNSVAILIAVVTTLAAAAAREHTRQAADAALRARARASLRKAVEFYRTKVATEGGYHFAYAEDLSYGRSEMSEGPTRVEIQREGTPLVGMTYLESYAATADTYCLDAARDVARALVKGQYCSGGWDYARTIPSTTIPSSMRLTRCSRPPGFTTNRAISRRRRRAVN